MNGKSGMNFSEYVAILSGNTELLKKAKVEKKITALESERKIKLSLESQNEPANTENVKKVKREENAVAVLAEPKARYRKVR